MEEKSYGTWSKEDLIRRLEILEDNVSKHNKKTNDKIENTESITQNKNKKFNEKKKFDFSKYNTRFIALKFAYLGWNYNGLAIQKEPTALPTVEGVIVDAMNKCKLIPSINPSDFKFSRCGRTDKGVSAMNQVISLNVRSNLTPEQQMNSEFDSKEIQYINILNQLLPDDIRISAVCLRPPTGFDARFSCQYRHYKYLFKKDGLNISAMETAASYFKGEHDFRNFCKLDGSKQITNFKRTMMSSQILQVNEEFYCFDLIGSAFLWHQVRCMTAILFLVGQNLEVPEIVSQLVDVASNPQKPIYDMASDIPLILYDCKFPEMDWIMNNVNDYNSIKYSKIVEGLTLGYQLKSTVATIFQDILPSADQDFQNKTRINLGDGKGKIVGTYEKLFKRKVMESYEIVNKKYKQRKKIPKNKLGLCNHL
ncbi:hypothetical protein TPHA_0P00530 [Tetrapisispora phaffii CBS 4417]|uniref:Pseudouridine synthase I TruA alpha/beta domain-containing protein n=1 Tax=Tetrapisispora phaffii (strain ATCC 24235 / CBS 4417 / NBRC 1672 / NRRL Y-8282 / UCD 70-5) TaxID=1071381 RepID=G8C233_TETPH|nr:hypothetical protein TPHA_0P00530 [Tetrapisispora phaffii CBS 4417]CCE66211.1 hypothetical protein TPHA_0P00530 [Tetrapisispora phaffii CBS 4417]